MSQNTVTTEQVHELIEQLAAMTAAASITPEIVANIFEKMRNLNDQERLKVIEIAEAYIYEIQNTGIPAEKVLMPNGSNAVLEFAKRIEFVDLANLDSTEPLPLAKNYLYNSKPVQSVYGEREEGGYYLAFSVGRESNEGYEPYNTDVMLFVSEYSAPNVFTYASRYNTGEDGLNEDETSAALAFGTGIASISRAGLMSPEDRRDMNALLTEVFPLAVTIASTNAGTREIGEEVTPNIVLSIARRGADVSSSAITTSSEGTVQSDHKTIIGSALTSGTTTFQISVSQGGQTVNAPAQTFSFLNYRYRGVVPANNIPSDATAKTNYVKQLCQNNTISKELSASTQLTGKNALAADKCYVFVIPTQSPNLIVKNANSGGVVDNAGTDTFELARVNGTGTVNCKYVIVPASSNAWNFEITN